MKRLRDLRTWAGVLGAAGIAAAACLPCCIAVPLAMAPLLAGLGISALSFEYGGVLIAAGLVALGWAAVAWFRQRRHASCGDDRGVPTCSAGRDMSAHHASPIACTLSPPDFKERGVLLR